MIIIINKNDSSNIYYIYIHHYLPNLEYFDHYFSLSWAGPGRLVGQKSVDVDIFRSMWFPWGSVKTTQKVAVPQS